jgi:3-methyl-2-oxobutanoate hydroxymethyltransferase
MSAHRQTGHSTGWTARRVRESKGAGRLVCVTAYDACFGRLADEAGIPIILVGDSVGMTLLGYDSTLPVTLDQMAHHTAAVVRGVSRALVVADMPFLSYQVSDDLAVAAAGRLLKEAGAGAVKLEGGAEYAGLVSRMTRCGIPVMGHIGLMPQQIRVMGGYRVQGRDPAAVERLIEDARALDQAGAFALVLEGLPAAVAGEITRTVSIPTIGIGAGPQCDGQVLVLHDLLGLTERPPKFARAYAGFRTAALDALGAFKADVESGAFPSTGSPEGKRPSP